MTDYTRELALWSDRIEKAIILPTYNPNVAQPIQHDDLHKPPQGFTPIPGSKKGGFHKLVGNTYHTWYPGHGLSQGRMDNVERVRSGLTQTMTLGDYLPTTRFSLTAADGKTTADAVSVMEGDVEYHAGRVGDKEVEASSHGELVDALHEHLYPNAPVAAAKPNHAKEILSWKYKQADKAKQLLENAPKSAEDIVLDKIKGQAGYYTTSDGYRIVPTNKQKPGGGQSVAAKPDGYLIYAPDEFKTSTGGAAIVDYYVPNLSSARTRILLHMKGKY